LTLDPSNPRTLEPFAAARLRELVLLFLKLGTTAFGGPAAHIAMMEDEVVRRRHWLTRDAFLDLVGATNLIPGPNSTELAIHIGYRQAGWSGLLVAGVCFILPAALIVTAVARAYMRFGQRPEAAALMYGVKPVIIAIIVQALIGLGRTALKTPSLAVVGTVALVLSVLRVHELALLLGAGVVMIAIAGIGSKSRAGVRPSHPPLVLVPPAFVAAAGAASLPSARYGLLTLVLPTGVVAAGAGVVPFSLTSLFLFFLKVGSVLFGSGYVLLAFLRADLVERWGWLTSAQLLDAVAVGQVTPGPLFTTATFIGYVLAGIPGAMVATIGIFLPAFVFVALSGPLIPRIRRSRLAGAFLDGVNVASLALMAFVTYELGRSALVDTLTIGSALIAAVLLIRWRLNSAWLILGGALLGLALFRR
jgi:chromate transporter